MPSSTSPYLVDNKLTAILTRTSQRAYMLKTRDGKTIWIRKGFPSAPNPLNWQNLDFNNTTTEQVFELSPWQMQHLEFLAPGESASWQTRGTTAATTTTTTPAQRTTKPAAQKPSARRRSVTTEITRTAPVTSYRDAFELAYKNAIQAYIDNAPNAIEEGIPDDLKTVEIVFTNARLKIWQEAKQWAESKRNTVSASGSDRYRRPNRVRLHLQHDPTVPESESGSIPFSAYTFDKIVHQAFVDKLVASGVQGADTLEVRIIRGWSY